MTIQEFMEGAHKWVDTHDKDPGKWLFGDFKKRRDDGSFDDEALVGLLQAGSEDLGGTHPFPVRPYPPPLKAVVTER